MLLALTHYATWPGSWATMQANALVLAPTYQFYFVAGALAAVHHDRFHAWVVGRPRAVVGALVVTAALHVGVYLVQLPSSGSVARAYDPLQPSVVPWTVAVTLGLYAVGIVYARSRRPGTRLATFVDQASVASFGVFLVHPSSSTPCWGAGSAGGTRLSTRRSPGRSRGPGPSCCRTPSPRSSSAPRWPSRWPVGSACGRDPPGA